MRRFLRRLPLRNWESQWRSYYFLNCLLTPWLIINRWWFSETSKQRAQHWSQLHIQLKETTFKNELKSPLLIYFYFHKILSTMLQDTKQKSSSKCFVQMKNVWTIFVVKVKYWLRKSANGRIGDLSDNKI